MESVEFVESVGFEWRCGGDEMETEWRDDGDGQRLVEIQ